MDRQKLHQLLLRYNSIYKDTDQVYHRLARAFGLSDCAFWILYLLQESDRTYTQAEICDTLSFARQTVNSAMKNMQSQGILRLVPDARSKKNKLICLTPQGEQLAQKTVDRVIDAELSTLEQFSPEERETFLALNQKYAVCLRREGEKLLAAWPKNEKI